ncbi:WD repeat-containing protein WRAP73 [Smittium culicis]|uniref:WD repeat-containing protein WRAP73 n=1 Tax=Smittium culicis TaxID=133412 RepID=A0A1R1WYW3_9FUNG|nr:WD repeat-containing protein WRAP73 [Smittium culicis]
MNLEFSKLFKHSRAISDISPSGEYLAIAIDDRLTVRQFDSLKILNIFETKYSKQPEITEIKWSPNSKHVLTANYKEDKVHVWDAFGSSKNFVFGFEDQVQGIIYANWSPLGNAIYTFSEFKRNIFEILTISRTVLKNIFSSLNSRIKRIYTKYLFIDGISFHPKGDFLAVLQRFEHKEQLGIYSTISWECLKIVPLNTLDSQAVEWSTCGNCICVWDTIGNYNIQIFNSIGILKNTFAQPDNELGIKTVSWSPTGQFLAIGSFDQKVKILFNVTWKPISSFTLKQNISNNGTEIFSEKVKQSSNYTGNYPPEIKFEHSLSPVNIEKYVPSDLSKPIIKAGVCKLSFNSDGTLLLCINGKRF